MTGVRRDRVAVVRRIDDDVRPVIRILIGADAAADTDPSDVFVTTSVDEALDYLGRFLRGDDRRSGPTDPVPDGPESRPDPGAP